MISLELVFFGFSRKDRESLIEDLLFSCCESFVAEVDYCVCGVRFLSTLVSGFSSGSRLGQFLTNWHDQLKTN